MLYLRRTDRLLLGPLPLRCVCRHRSLVRAIVVVGHSCGCRRVKGRRDVFLTNIDEPMISSHKRHCLWSTPGLSAIRKLAPNGVLGTYTPSAGSLATRKPRAPETLERGRANFFLPAEAEGGNTGRGPCRGSSRGLIDTMAGAQ